MIGGLEPVSDGEVRVLGTDMLVESERGRTLLRRRDIGIVFQAYHLVPSMTAQQNAALPLLITHKPGHMLITDIPDDAEIPIITKKTL